jgi:hypothetical protein
MSIAKLYRRDNQPFAVIPNEAIRDPRISPNAFRLLAYIMSHQDGYEVTYDQIERQTTLGRWAINQAIHQLTDLGWLEVARPKLSNGQFGAKTWTVLNPNSTTVGHSTVEQPHMVQSTDNKKNTSIEEQEIKESNYAQNEFERQFKDFYTVYPRKVAKGAAVSAFRKALKNESFDTILAGVIRFANDPNKPSKEFLPYPATWLNSWGWENEPYPERSMSKAEREAWEWKQVERNREMRRAATAEALEESRRAKERAEANPVEGCEHRAVKLLCSICR